MHIVPYRPPYESVEPVSYSARPHDRRQRNRPVLYDRRISSQERRQGDRRAVASDGRRQGPQPPCGVDVWV